MAKVSLELDLARNLFGRLDPDLRERLSAVVNKPAECTWTNARSIIVAHPFVTLWQAVATVEPRFRMGGVPDQETLIRALRYATH